MKFVLGGALLVTLVSGCTSYKPLPLATAPAAADSLDALVVAATPTGGKAPIDLKDGLDLRELASLAVLNNPDLAATRSSLGVAKAQAFAAGLLPDPQLSLSLDNPLHGADGVVKAYSLGLGYSLSALLTRGAREDAAGSHLDSVRLDLLWREWQLISEVQSLAVGIALQQRQLDLLEQVLGQYRQRYQGSSKALALGNVTLTTTGTDLTALLDVLSQRSQLQQQLSQSRHRLALLLGLSPSVAIPLAPLPALAPLGAQAVAKRRGELTHLRPDLQALQAGYASQEAAVRAAVLNQFPGLSLGINRARDTGGLATAGLSIGLDLPLFDGNRGAIAVERASREQLWHEYQARLTQTDNAISQLEAQQGLLGEQQQALESYLPKLAALVNRGAKAFKRGDIDALSYLNMESTYTAKELEALGVLQSRWQADLALRTLLAMPYGLRSTEQQKASR
ncbi:TolC family protein [Gallaecimonas kandeliae]|uniref:TolC family protein n=1 Tax=Gallaecimonas kandeliae TaxID=3029055 RepID=UPI002648BF43|nr:TolC family protein [Gallaecimonas kandeliae]WKE66613.1 TolC family protein [Gallaecimonas kandeliae]